MSKTHASVYQDIYSTRRYAKTYLKRYKLIHVGLANLIRNKQSFCEEQIVLGNVAYNPKSHPVRTV
jgi:hypothetical protein